MLPPHRLDRLSTKFDDNHLIAHESGELYNVEVSARKFGILYAHDNFIVHTNHYLDVNMQAIENRCKGYLPPPAPKKGK